MNCGFEDVIVLDEVWNNVMSGNKNAPDSIQMELILQDYTKLRTIDAESICNLALNNYSTTLIFILVEMRSSVTKTKYVFRKKIETFLNRLFPKYVIPLYTMVSFTRIRYSEALKRHNIQTYWFELGLAASKGFVVAAMCLLLYKNYYKLVINKV
jgi:kynurenine 3-monooxygenase